MMRRLQQGNRVNLIDFSVPACVDKVLFEDEL